jgi:hypothetical protein
MCCYHCYCYNYYYEGLVGGGGFRPHATILADIASAICCYTGVEGLGSNTRVCLFRIVFADEDAQLAPFTGLLLIIPIPLLTIDYEGLVTGIDVCQEATGEEQVATGWSSGVGGPMPGRCCRTLSSGGEDGSKDEKVSAILEVLCMCALWHPPSIWTGNCAISAITMMSVCPCSLLLSFRPTDGLHAHGSDLSHYAITALSAK